jgi:hypothetical protein
VGYAVPITSGHVAIEGVLVAAADAALLAAPLHRAGDKDVASRLLGALRENLELRDVSMDDRLAIGRALEECPGDMVELRARLLSKPQPTWRQQPSTDLLAPRASLLKVLEAL